MFHFYIMTAPDEKNINPISSNSSDFSIDHILNRAGNKPPNYKSDMGGNCSTSDIYPWLQCTRYCPPKIPRNQKKEGPHKRQLGRHPRIPFSNHQLNTLEEKFQQSPYLSSEEVTKLSQQLHLADIRVKIWFQNRRARERREKSIQVPKSENIQNVNLEQSTNNDLNFSHLNFYTK